MNPNQDQTRSAQETLFPFFSFSFCGRWRDMIFWSLFPTSLLAPVWSVSIAPGPLLAPS